MNRTTTAPAAVSPACADDLVLEDLAPQATEEFQPGTCICWVEDRFDA